MARDGSSSRWFARPIRCASRDCALGRADMDHEVDVAPVDAEVERRGADHGAELSRRHRGLDLAPLARIERAVVKRDRQPVDVDPPQFLEDQLGLRSAR